MVKDGNKYLRDSFVEAAARGKVHDVEFRRYYEAKQAEVRKHAEKRALALTAQKLVHLVQLSNAPRKAGA